MYSPNRSSRSPRAVWGGELLAGGLGGFERAGHLWPVRLPERHRRAGDDERGPAVRRGRRALRDPRRINYEGQAAAELEAACDPAARDAYPMPVAEPPRRPAAPAVSSGAAAAAPLVLDARATIAAVVEDLARGVAPGVVAARFHGALARATADACALVAARRGLDAVVLSGGAFQNRVLLEGTTALLDEAGLRVLVPRRLPPNDGGIAYGQAAIAAHSE